MSIGPLPFDRIVISTDENEKYIQFWPLVSKAWKKYFPEIKVDLAFVTDKDRDDPYILKMSKYGSVTVFNTIDGIPNGNLAKVARYFLASRYLDDVCVCYDIDSLPMQRNYLVNLIQQRMNGFMLAVGAEVYKNTPHEGKFPAGFFTATGSLFERLFNPNKCEFTDAVCEFKSLQVFDQKESICNKPENFSDESLIRALIKLNGMHDKIQHVTRNVNPDVQWIDRSRWSINKDRLLSDGYTECNMLRPLSNHYYAMIPVIEHICGAIVPLEKLIIK